MAVTLLLLQLTIALLPPSSTPNTEYHSHHRVTVPAS